MSRSTLIPLTRLRKVLNDLIAWSLTIKTREPRQVDADDQPTTRRRSGAKNAKWDHCRYALVSEVWDQINTPFAPDYVKALKASKVKQCPHLCGQPLRLQRM
jgi:hypothetical protein